MSKLTKMRFMFIAKNATSDVHHDGRLPNMSQWTNMVQLGIDRNRFIGPPPDWRLWSRFVAAFISYNYFSGSVPPYHPDTNSTLERVVLWANNLRCVRV
jgi:hypothetical protein